MSMDQTIKFSYKSSPGYNPVHVNGVYGGFITSGLLVANFFLERFPEEKEEIFELLEDGSLGNQINEANSLNQVEVTRFIETGISMNIETARALRDWLNNYIPDTSSHQEI